MPWIHNISVMDLTILNWIRIFSLRKNGYNFLMILLYVLLFKDPDPCFFQDPDLGGKKVMDSPDPEQNPQH